jgi:phosphatidylserine synthase
MQASPISGIETATRCLPQRLAYAVAIIMFGVAPAHFFISCRQSEALGVGAFVASGVCAALCFASSKATRHRIWPLALGLVALLFHMFSVH